MIPSGVEVSYTSGRLTVKGPKGELSRSVRDEMSFVIADGSLSVNPVARTRFARALWGTYASHARNMVVGVTEGFKKELEVQGVGYRAEMKGSQLVLQVGFSHPVAMDVPVGLEVQVKDNVITVEGADKETVSAFAAEVRQVRKPEPYTGKGIRYVGEAVRRKQSKRSE